jgi:gamma-glutamyltranspeptidase/glutathione hydrolase
MTHGTVASADRLATEAGTAVLAKGGTAIDAAIATNAVMAVVAPHLCGVGGDLMALVHTPDRGMDCLMAAGRAGSGADAAALRAEGHPTMPLYGDIRTVTVPGCVDGWTALAERATLPLADLLSAAIDYASNGFPASPLLARSCQAIRSDPGPLSHLVTQATHPNAVVKRPGLARALRDVAADGRDGFYCGEFGDGLLSLGKGWFTRDDFARPGASWVTPLRTRAFGVDLWTAPPVSQGYLWLAASSLADQFELPDPADPMWAHLLVEASVATGRDRPEVLFDGADGDALLTAAASRTNEIHRSRASSRTGRGSAGDTTYLCAVDSTGTAVSLIQSNAAGFGSRLVEPSTGINLHNRGLGFSLVPGHAAELRPGVRPPHTLLPGMATDAEGLRAVLGTMGGDAQPQVLLQLATRLFRHGLGVRETIAAPRWALYASVGFDTWTAADTAVIVEGDAPAAWLSGLAALGHRVATRPAYDSSFGHAHAIVRTSAGWEGAADPRTLVGSAIEV